MYSQNNSPVLQLFWRTMPINTHTTAMLLVVANSQNSITQLGEQQSLSNDSKIIWVRVLQCAQKRKTRHKKLQSNHRHLKSHFSPPSTL